MWNTFSLMLLPWVLFHKRQFWQRSYTVDDDNNQTFQVFCDFDSEPGFAWNLIESFSLSNKDRFQVFTFSLIFYKYLINERRTKAHSAERCEIHSISCCFHKFCFISDSFDDDHNFLINSASSAGGHRVLRWLPSHQRWCPKLAGLPHQTTLPPLAQRSLDSLESYLPIQHRWHRIHRLPESLAWRLWHH